MICFYATAAHAATQRTFAAALCTLSTALRALSATLCTLVAALRTLAAMVRTSEDIVSNSICPFFTEGPAEFLRALLYALGDGVAEDVAPTVPAVLLGDILI